MYGTGRTAKRDSLLQVKQHRSTVSQGEGATRASPTVAIRQRLANITNVGRNTPSKDTLLKSIPDKSKLCKRVLPDELKQTNRPAIPGNQAQLEALYDHTKNIAREFFSASHYKTLFPAFLSPNSASRLSFMSNSRLSISSVKSQIPVKRSSILPDTDLTEYQDNSLSNAFSVMNSLLKDKARVTNLADFCLLYVGTVISLGTEEAAKNALIFLNNFLKIGAVRQGEANVLFSILVKACTYPKLRSNVISCITKLATLEASLVKRVENGTTSNNEELSNMCKEVLNRMGVKRSPENQFDSIAEQVDEKSAIEKLEEFVETLQDNGQPSDIVQFMRSITRMMCKFPESSVVLGRAAECMELVISFCEIPMEIAYECLSVTTAVLSGEIFLSGEGSFEAVEALQTLCQSLFVHVEARVLMKALAGLVAQSNGVKFAKIMDLMRDYVKQKDFIPAECFIEIEDTLAAFHPDVEVPLYLRQDASEDQFERYERSIRRMNNPDTFFDEMRNVVSESTDGDFSAFPISVRKHLQAQWIVQNGTRPPHTPDDIWDGLRDARIGHWDEYKVAEVLKKITN